MSQVLMEVDEDEYGRQVATGRWSIDGDESQIFASREAAEAELRRRQGGAVAPPKGEYPRGGNRQTRWIQTGPGHFSFGFFKFLVCLVVVCFVGMLALGDSSYGASQLSDLGRLVVGGAFVVGFVFLICWLCADNGIAS